MLNVKWSTALTTHKFVTERNKFNRRGTDRSHSRVQSIIIVIGVFWPVDSGASDHLVGVEQSQVPTGYRSHRDSLVSASEFMASSYLVILFAMRILYSGQCTDNSHHPFGKWAPQTPSRLYSAIQTDNSKEPPDL